MRSPKGATRYLVVPSFFFLFSEKMFHPTVKEGDWKTDQLCVCVCSLGGPDARCRRPGVRPRDSAERRPVRRRTSSPPGLVFCLLFVEGLELLRLCHDREKDAPIVYDGLN